MLVSETHSPAAWNIWSEPYGNWKWPLFLQIFKSTWNQLQLREHIGAGPSPGQLGMLCVCVCVFSNLFTAISIANHSNRMHCARTTAVWFALFLCLDLYNNDIVHRSHFYTQSKSFLGAIWKVFRMSDRNMCVIRIARVCVRCTFRERPVERCAPRAAERETYKQASWQTFVREIADFLFLLTATATYLLATTTKRGHTNAFVPFQRWYFHLWRNIVWVRSAVGRKFERRRTCVCVCPM